ncbi:hypothetical protein TPHA_0G01210 [Tetrapisispora phaffii CBS 4417]|uniref:RGS domain-containing protein n=1 Tax=Tetrapisispora phaffii (strain ATCC 24235 / CBS 4417 / NBRC 1672 / NRRL Y-8282 / UCD 70-5) TaxID=1071381 RepID=G8BVN0_TETPH|nr:hypothetical protein TPHA_0G01210 [Tetrapisispora phaffii CBS 4417]CCE63958.1 hypothetical protein TPHA_0G01210 [Tetrapisispora phaffii CBS 4417]
MAIDFEKLQEERLPTLYEVLILKTEKPVDLWSFYTFLSQFPHAINYLEFWIDLMAHIRLCKDYLENIRSSVIEVVDESRVSDEYGNLTTAGDHRKHKEESSSDRYGPGGNDGDADDSASVTSSLLINALMNEGYLDFQDPDQVNRFLQGDIEYSPQLSQLLAEWRRHSGIPGKRNDDVNESEIDENTGEKKNQVGYENKILSAIDDLLKNHVSGQNNAGETIKPQITTKQLHHNAAQICTLYLLSPERSDKYLINIPEHVREDTLKAIQNDKRYDPDVFEELKNISYQFLEIDCFTKFLGRVALHNLHDQISDWRFHNSSTRFLPNEETHEKKKQLRHHSRSLFSSYTTLSRVMLGLFFMGIGFWIGYALIFLNYARGIRVVTIVPFIIGSYFIVCGIYQIDIAYACFGITQELMYKHKRSPDEETNHSDNLEAKDGEISGLFKILGGQTRLIKIKHPFIRNLIYKRGLWCLLWVLISTGVFTVIFACVPSRRV